MDPGSLVSSLLHSSCVNDIGEGLGGKLGFRIERVNSRPTGTRSISRRDSKSKEMSSCPYETQRLLSFRLSSIEFVIPYNWLSTLPSKVSVPTAVHSRLSSVSQNSRLKKIGRRNGRYSKSKGDSD